MKEGFKKKLVRSRPVKGMGDERLAMRADVRKVDGKRGEGDRECDGRSALRENGEQQQKLGAVREK